MTLHADRPVTTVWRSRIGRLVGLASSLAALAVPVVGQEKPVTWRVDAPADTLRPGQWSSLTVRADIDAPWHLYSLTQPRPPIATVIAAGPADLVRARQASQPKPKRQWDATFEITSELFEGSVAFELPVSVSASTAPGRHDGYVTVLYQACTDEVCLPPAEDTLPVTFIAGAAKPAAPGERGGRPNGSASLPGSLTEPVTRSSSTTTSTGVVGDPAASNAAADDPAANDPGEVADATDSASVALADADPAAVGAATTQIGAPMAPGAAGLWSFLALAALMGGLALLTPCVFPMIPITVSYFTKRHQADDGGGMVRSRVALDALIYGGGIILAFSGLGLALALIFGATGINRFAANPWINLLVGALFVGFALDLLGAIEFRLPWRLVASLNRGSDRDGLTGLLLMGVVFAVTTFTCTVPFVGTLLVSAAAGDWMWPLLGLLVFSTIFALPFFLLALLPNVLHSLPRSGSWMGALKFTLGLIELGAAFKFFSNADLVWQAGLLPRGIVIAIWIALSALIALYLLGQIRLTRDHVAGAAPGIGIPRLLFGGAFLAFAAFLASGLIGRPLGDVEAFLPPHQYPGEESIANTGSGAEAPDELTWFASYEEGLQVAKAANRPMFIDFTGYTCTNCRWMEQNVFRRGDVQELFSQYVLVRLYTDGRGERYTRNRNMQLARFGTVAMPLYAILDSNGESIATLAGMTRKSERFTDFLRSALQDAS